MSAISDILGAGVPGVILFLFVLLDVVLHTRDYKTNSKLIARISVRAISLLGYAWILRIVASLVSMSKETTASGFQAIQILGLLGRPQQCIMVYMRLSLSLCAVWLASSGCVSVVKAICARKKCQSSTADQSLWPEVIKHLGEAIWRFCLLTIVYFSRLCLAYLEN